MAPATLKPPTLIYRHLATACVESASSPLPLTGLKIPSVGDIGCQGVREGGSRWSSGPDTRSSSGRDPAAIGPDRNGVNPHRVPPPLTAQPNRSPLPEPAPTVPLYERKSWGNPAL